MKLVNSNHAMISSRFSLRISASFCGRPSAREGEGSGGVCAPDCDGRTRRRCVLGDGCGRAAALSVDEHLA
eukprot:2079844-Pleurochrysis_carterae.AAC.1